MKTFFMEVDEQEEDEHHEFVRDDEPFLRLFCQVGDKSKGWCAKTIQMFVEVVLTKLEGGRSGHQRFSDKTTPRPAWFNKNVWPK